MLRPKIIEYKKCQQEGLIEQERAETRLYNEWNWPAAAALQEDRADNADDITA